MSEPQKSRSSFSRREEMNLRADPLMSDGDDRFLRSLTGLIEQEKRYLRCPEDGPHELRYIIYRSAFNKVIGRATAYKRLLLTIKMGYDDVIRMLQRSEDDVRTTERSLRNSTSHPESHMTCQRRAAQLRERISVLQRETAELQAENTGQKSSAEQSTWIPGLTLAQSVDPEALDRHLQHLEEQRASLLDRRSNCVSLDVKTELDAKRQAAKRHRDQLSIESTRLKVLHERLMFVSDRLSSWELEKQQVPLEELLSSTVENIRQTSVKDGDAELLGDEEAARVPGYLDRFIELLDSAQYEEAALHAARSPRGVLRNLDTMQMFEDVKGPPGSVPPLLLFVQALLMTLPAGDKLPAALALRVVCCALQHGATRLVNHAATHDKLTYSEDLGDILTEHAQKNPIMADLCLALATDIYEACGLNRKTALSMCRRGLIHCAAEFMRHCKNLTAEDCMWVLCRSPSLTLLQLLTEHRHGQAAILSVGVACSSLLADPQQQPLALQFLDGFISRGRGVLEEVILEDSSSSVDVWADIASLCSGLNRADLSQAILSILLDQSGTGVLSPDLQGARLMEHVFL